MSFFKTIQLSNLSTKARSFLEAYLKLTSNKMEIDKKIYTDKSLLNMGMINPEGVIIKIPEVKMFYLLSGIFYQKNWECLVNEDIEWIFFTLSKCKKHISKEEKIKYILKEQLLILKELIDNKFKDFDQFYLQCKKDLEDTEEKKSTFIQCILRGEKLVSFYLKMEDDKIKQIICTENKNCTPYLLRIKGNYIEFLFVHSSLCECYDKHEIYYIKIKNPSALESKQTYGLIYCLENGEYINCTKEDIELVEKTFS